jgi:hypothetical protein
MQIATKQTTELIPPNGCEMAISRPFEDSKITVTLRWESQAGYLKSDEDELEAFEQQALRRGVETLVYVTPDAVWGYHRVDERQIGSRRYNPRTPAHWTPF